MYCLIISDLSFTQSIASGTSDFSTLDVPESRSTSTNTTRFAILDNNIRPIVQLIKNGQILDDDTLVLSRDMNDGASIQGVFTDDPNITWHGGDYSLRHGVAYLNGSIITSIALVSYTTYYLGRVSVPPIRTIYFTGVHSSSDGNGCFLEIDTNGIMRLSSPKSIQANEEIRFNVSYVYK